jgi:TatA/E family protein of Tat protein translocase
VFGIGATELVIIMVVALLVFGPKRLPELARSLGRGMAEFRRASSDLRQTLQEVDPSNDVVKPPEPAAGSISPRVTTASPSDDGQKASGDTSQADQADQADQAGPADEADLPQPEPEGLSKAAGEPQASNPAKARSSSEDPGSRGE